jgi:hypothetical protein
VRCIVALSLLDVSFHKSEQKASQQIGPTTHFCSFFTLNRKRGSGEHVVGLFCPSVCRLCQPKKSCCSITNDRIFIKLGAQAVTSQLALSCFPRSVLLTSRTVAHASVLLLTLNEHKRNVLLSKFNKSSKRLFGFDLCIA